MINIYEKLKYKSGKAITTALNKAERKDLLELKPYDRLDYKQSLDILEVIESHLPKTKKGIAQGLIRSYKQNIENGITNPNQAPIKKEKPLPKDLDYSEKDKMVSLKDELYFLGYKEDKEKFSDVYIRFLRCLKKDKIYSAMRKFIEHKISFDKDRSRYFDYKATFAYVISQEEQIDLIHIDEMIYIYEFYLNYSFCIDYAKNRLKFWEQKREEING